MHVTLFDRAARDLRVASIRALTIDDPAVVDAARQFGMQVR